MFGKQDQTLTLAWKIEMESFANNVNVGGGVRFDPFLEEKGGWIYREAPKHDVKMVDAIIWVMVEASQSGSEDGLNPFRAQFGEKIPLNV